MRKRVSDSDTDKTTPTQQVKEALDATLKERAKIVQRNVELAKKNLLGRLKVEHKGDSQKVSADHPNEWIGNAFLMEAIGVADIDFLNGLISQLCEANSRNGKIEQRDLNFVISIIKGNQRKDRNTAMLAVQMASIHMAMMRETKILANATTIQETDSAGRLVNQLARTFASQMETLKRYVTGDGSQVTIQNVSVNEGGQAIVGNVTRSSATNTAEQASAAPTELTDAKIIRMPQANARKERVADCKSKCRA